MEILYLLIPLSTALVLFILGVFAWALHGGQFEDLEREGERILLDEPPVPTGRPADIDRGQNRPPGPEGLSRTI